MATKETEERVKPIILHDEEHQKDYTLEFSRESVVFAEQRGFSLNDLERYPMVKMPEFFFYAFRMHHPNISKGQTDKILFEMLGGMPDGMAERLGELYAVPYNALNNGGEQGKNGKMTVEM